MLCFDFLLLFLVNKGTVRDPDQVEALGFPASVQADPVSRGVFVLSRVDGHVGLLVAGIFLLQLLSAERQSRRRYVDRVLAIRDRGQVAGHDILFPSKVKNIQLAQIPVLGGLDLDIVALAGARLQDQGLVGHGRSNPGSIRQVRVVKEADG